MNPFSNAILNPMRALALSLLLCLSGFGYTQTLAEGTEVLLTDLGSQTIVGHGKVAEGKLELDLSENAQAFFLYIVSPGGEVATHNGELSAAGELEIFGDNGELVEFANVLRQGGVDLELETRNLDTPESDDELLEPPAN